MTKTVLQKIAIILMFSFLLFSIIFSFEDKSYSQEKDIDIHITEALFSPNDKKYYAFVQFNEYYYSVVIEKNIFDKFHNEGQEPMSIVLKTSEEDLGVHRSPMFFISLLLSILTFSLLISVLFISFFVKENK